jgi:hypothetical protein
MAWLIGDGFDCYAALADAARGVWDSQTGGSLQTGRFGGLAVQGALNAVAITKVFATNESTIFVVFAGFKAGALSGTAADGWFLLRDGATTQVAIVCQSDGTLQLRSGSTSGTILAAFAGAFVQDTWIHLQCKVVIHPTAGSFTVRKNGSPTDDFTLGGLNTRGGTANSYVNQFAVGGSSNPYKFDDLLVYSSAGAAPNDWVGDIRAIQMPVVGDTATAQYAVVPTAMTANGGGTTNGALTVPANQIYFFGPTALTTRSGSVDKIRVTLGAGSPNPLVGRVKMAVYNADGPNGPGSLLAVSQEVVNPPGGNLVTVDFPFSPPFPWSWRRQYYFGTLTDASWASASGWNQSGAVKIVAQPYASGFPSTITTVTTGGTMQPSGVAIIGSHSIAVSEALANSDTDYTVGTAAGQKEIYEVDDIVGTPLAIIGVVTKAFVKKNDAGTRTGQLVVKSGATEVYGVDTAVSTTYGYLTRVDTVDPATGLAWTPGTFAALQIGTRVTS